MPTHYPFVHSKVFHAVIALVISVLLLTACNLPAPVAPTPIPLPSSTPQPLQDTPTLAPPSPTPQPTPTTGLAPINLTFSPGTTAVVQSGTLQPGQVQTLTLGAGQYQPMILLVTSPSNDVYLGVSEPDGTKLLDPANKWNSWQWLLPKTETYTIQVYAGATTETYNLTAKVAQVVNFSSGSASITLNGTTANGFVFSYALSCQANQTMTVSLNVPSSTAYLDVFGLATGPLLSFSAKATSWSGTLPSTQDYVVEVIPNNGQVVNYSITISVH